MKLLPDNTILLGLKEVLPSALVGKYVPVKGEPHRYVRMFRPCTFRIPIKVCLPCGKEVTDQHCTQFDKGVSPSICGACNDGKEPTIRPTGE
jgi:hypothetical protein